MFVLVVGGGKVGYYLTKELIESGHEVALMEKDRARAQQITDEIGSVVIGQDGCEGKYLNEAGANRADIVAAVTGDDEDNLVICQMAKHHFDVPRTIARVNNPKNEALFRHLGVDEIISPTRMILGSIEQDIPVHELLHLAALGIGELEIIEAHLQRGSPAIGKVALDLSVPTGCSLFGVIREGVADAPADGHRARRGGQGDRHRPARLRGPAARAAHRGSRRGLTRDPGKWSHNVTTTSLDNGIVRVLACRNDEQAGLTDGPSTTRARPGTAGVRDQRGRDPRVGTPAHPAHL